MKHGRDPQGAPQGRPARSADTDPSGGPVISTPGPRKRGVHPQPGLTKDKSMKGLILAQSERWRRGLGMQVERETGGNSGSKAAKG